VTGARLGAVRRPVGSVAGSVIAGSVVAGSVIAVAALLVLAGCGTGTLATPDATAPGGSASASAQSSAAGPTLVVTVPELPLASAPAEVPAPSVAESPAAPPAAEGPTEAQAPEPDPPTEAVPPAEPPTPAAPAAEPAQPAVTAPPPAPAGDQLPISLANCDGCSVLATHRGVTGELSAALVGTQAGRAILLSVGTDGQVKGVIGVPYGASFAAPSDGVLSCDSQARCAVEGTQTDGRAILSAFELTGTGAWRDVSGDDAFPSATERAGVIDLGGELGLAVQDQGDGAAVWMLYQWGGDRFTVAGCAPDSDSPPSAAQVSQDLCLS